MAAHDVHCVAFRQLVDSEHTDRRTYDHAEMAALRRVATCVAARAGLEDVFALVARECAALVGADGASVMCIDGAGPDRAVLVGAALRHADAGVGRALRISGDCAAAQVLRTGQPKRTEEPGRTGSCCPADFACHTAVAAPVHLAGELWGVVMAASEGLAGVPAPGAEFLLDELGRLIAFAVDNARLHAQLVASAKTDPLTGLANRRSFDEQLDREVQRARRQDHPLSVALIDLDNFKSVNDASGHQAGDALLVRLARALHETLRKEELLARIGGDELALILPETVAAAALQVATRLQLTAAAVDDGTLPAVSLSVGVCELADAADTSTLIRRADAALYDAKQAGGATARAWMGRRESVPATQLARRQAQLGLRALARAVDLRDAGTQRHSERVASVAGALALADGWKPAQVSAICDVATVHDIGKVAVPDTILRKPNGLDAAEYEVVKRHPVVGAEITAEILTPEQVSWLRHHHERWDGQGYPDRLAHEEIPLGARLLALADAWDVMVSQRPYKQPLSQHEALAECQRQAGRQFCPHTVALLQASIADGAMRATVPTRRS